MYNVHSDTARSLEKNYRIRCRINGQEFQSIAAAQAVLKLSETVIRNRVNNNYSGYEILEKIDHGYTPVIIEGKEYESLNSLVAAGLAKNREQVGRLLRSKHPKWKNWNYKYGKKKAVRMHLRNLMKYRDY